MKKYFLFLTFLFALISCQDNVTFNSPAFEGQKDNVFWRASSSKATLVSGSLIIEGNMQDEKITLKVNSTNIGIYILGTIDQENMAYYVPTISDINSSLYETAITTGPVNKVLISSAGTGYSNGVTVPTSGGRGSGLKVNTVVTALGAIRTVTVTSFGSGYTAGDLITILGGNGNATLTVQNVSTSNGEIEITEFDTVNKTVSGTYKFNAININNDASVVSNLNFQHGVFYKVPVK